MINCFENKIKTAIIEVEKLNILKLETKPTRDCKLPPILADQVSTERKRSDPGGTSCGDQRCRQGPRKGCNGEGRAV